MVQWTDDEIIQGLGDPARRNDAFRALVARYEGPLLGYLRKLCDGDMEHAKDLLGPVFSKAYRWLTEHSESCRSLGGLLYKVARNTALDDLCKGSPDPLDGALQLNEELAGLPIAPAPSEINAATQARDAALAEVMAQLEEQNPRHRMLLEMEADGCSRDDIATATGIEKRQLTQYLKRAQAAALKLARSHPVLAAWAQDRGRHRPNEETPSRR